MKASASDVSTRVSVQQCMTAICLVDTKGTVLALVAIKECVLACTCRLWTALAA